MINKNKQQIAKAAQAAQAVAPAPVKVVLPATTEGEHKLNMTPQSINGISPHIPPRVAPPAKRAALVKPTGPSAAAAAAAARKSPPPKLLLPHGVAPAGASLTKVIGMIAEVVNAKGDVNIVGPNASALLKYIRVVGVDINLRAAEHIWATGMLPPLPSRNEVDKVDSAAPSSPANGVKRRLEADQGSATVLIGEAKKPRMETTSA